MLVETAVIRAASLQYTCDSLGSGDDAILSTCDSFKCGGQVEPTAETDNMEPVWVSYARCRSGTDLRLQPCVIAKYVAISVAVQGPVACAAVSSRQRWGHRTTGDVQGILLQAAS